MHSGYNYLLMKLLLLKKEEDKLKNILTVIMMMLGFKGMGKSCLICLKNSVIIFQTIRCEKCIGYSCN
jgi:hypothetical protein